MADKPVPASMQTLRAAFRRFRKRFLAETKEDRCKLCPAMDLLDGHSSFCVDVCGAVWPELVHGDREYAHVRAYDVDCPCHCWGREKATRKLKEFCR